MDILEIVAIEIPCSACGGRYEVTLKQIALSQQLLHEGCPVQVVDECPPLAYFVPGGSGTSPGASKNLDAPRRKSTWGQRRTEIALPIMEHVLMEASW